MISLTDVREFITPSPEEEAKLQLLIATAIQGWDYLTGKNWSMQTDRVETQNMEGRYPKSLFLELKPVISITSIEERGSPPRSFSLDSGWTIVDPENYELMDAETGKIIRHSGYWSPFVRAIYTGGYDSDSTPESIKYALLLQVSFLRKRNAQELITLQSQNFEGGQGVFHVADYHPTFKAIADSFK